LDGGEIGLRAALLCTGCCIASIAVAACGDLFPRGQMRDGVVTGFPLTFISTEDGRVYEVEMADGSQRGSKPLVFADRDESESACVRVDSSLAPAPGTDRGLPVLIVHRVVRSESYLNATGEPNCRFGGEQEYTGLLYFPPEGVSFYVSSEAKPLWPHHLRGQIGGVLIETPGLDYARYACLKVRGVLSQRGRFGHLGRQERQLTVTRILRVRRWEEAPECRDLFPLPPPPPPPPRARRR
jgi:hypothetical protein